MSDFIEQQSKIRLSIHQSTHEDIGDQAFDFEDQQPYPVDLQLASTKLVPQLSQKKPQIQDQNNNSLKSYGKMQRQVAFQQQKEEQQIGKEFVAKWQGKQNEFFDKNNKFRQSTNQGLLHDDNSEIYQQNGNQKGQQQVQQNERKQEQYVKIEHIESSRSKKIKIKNASLAIITNQYRNEYAQRECRICLQNQGQGRLIRPCVCSGSINHVHQKCIRQWILRKTDIKGRKKVRCQVCDFQYKYKVVKNRQLSCQQYKRSYQNNIGTFRCFYLVMSILFLGLLAMITVVILSATQTQVGQNIQAGLIYTDSSRIIFACVCFLYFNILLFAIILFAVEYAVKLQISIQDVLDIMQIVPKKMNKKVYPKIQKANKQTTQNNQS